MVQIFYYSNKVTKKMSIIENQAITTLLLSCKLVTKISTSLLA